MSSQLMGIWRPPGTGPVLVNLCLPPAQTLQTPPLNAKTARELKLKISDTDKILTW